MEIDLKNVVTGVSEVFKKIGGPSITFRKPKDLRELVHGTVEVHGEKDVFRFRRSGEYFSMKYSELSRYIDMIGTALHEMNLSGRRIAVMGETTPEWIIAYLATTCGNGVIVPLDKELSTESLIDFLALSGAECLFYSESYAFSVAAMKEKLPNVRYWISMPMATYYPPISIELQQEKLPEGDCSFQKVAGRGKKLLRDGVRDYVDCEIDREKMCALLFTSGTTGTSKGVMLSHKNIVTAVYGVLTRNFVGPDEVFMSVLPIHHTYEMSCGILTPMNIGCTIGINDSLKGLSRNFAEYRPTIITLVPVFLSSMYKKIWDAAVKNGSDKKLKTGIRLSNATRLFGIDLREKLFSEVNKAFGGRLKRIICGGAPLNPDYVDWFEELGIIVIQGYGITECAPLVTVMPYKCKNAASVGKPLDGISLYIDKEHDDDETGEIIVKGDNVMLGYYENPDATEEVLSNGWFRTGDYGYIDRKGYLYITGRKKNVIIASNGKNVFPEELEEYLNSCGLISECVVVGRTGGEEEEVRITAIIYPDYDEATKRGLTSATEINAALKEEVAEINKKLPIYKKIRGIEVRRTPFPKTTTNKIKRHEVQ